MSSPETILQIAQTIHADLSPQHRLYGKISEAITQLEARQIESNDLVLLLASDESTRQPMAQLLNSAGASEIKSKGFELLAGQANPVTAQQYICPEPNCGYTAYRPGSAIPQCPTHKIDLQPVGNS